MSFFLKVLDFVFTGQSGRVRGDVGGGEIVTAVHAACPGDASVPMRGDVSVVIPSPRTGGRVAVSYIDPAQPFTGNPGDKVIYSRDSSSVSASVELLNTGQIVISNANGNITLAPDGTVSINGGLTIDATGNITTTGTISAASIAAPLIQVGAGTELAGHVHGGVTSGGQSTAPLI